MGVLMINKILTDIAKDEVSNYLDSIDYYTQLNTIGSFGKVVFEVSSLKILSPESYKITRGSIIKKIPLINNPDFSIFQGRQLLKISFSVKLIYSLTNIENARKTLSEYVDTGQHFPLILSGQKIGDNTFIITNYTENVIKTDRIGTPLVVELNLEFEEYISTLQKQKQLKVQQKGVSPLERKVVSNINSKILEKLSQERLW